jgi:hypothetical protein
MPAPGIGALDFAGGQGNTFGGAAGPSGSDSGGFSFGNIVSGGSGGFNPFVTSNAGQVTGQLLTGSNLLIIGGLVLGGFYLWKKK